MGQGSFFIDLDKGPAPSATVGVRVTTAVTGAITTLLTEPGTWDSLLANAKLIVIALYKSQAESDTDNKSKQVRFYRTYSGFVDKEQPLVVNTDLLGSNRPNYMAEIKFVTQGNQYHHVGLYVKPGLMESEASKFAQVMNKYLSNKSAYCFYLEKIPNLRAEVRTRDGTDYITIAD